nr:hypothetical protein OG999_29640 [Streptomyces sp. NBC_00886]
MFQVYGLDEAESHLWRASLQLRCQVDGVVHRQLIRDTGLSVAGHEILPTPVRIA